MPGKEIPKISLMMADLKDTFDISSKLVRFWKVSRRLELGKSEYLLQSILEPVSYGEGSFIGKLKLREDL